MAAHKEDLVSTLESSLQVLKRLQSLPELICYICVFKVRNLSFLRHVYLCYLSPIMWRKMARKPMSTKAVSSLALSRAVILMREITRQSASH